MAKRLSIWLSVLALLAFPASAQVPKATITAEIAASSAHGQAGGTILNNITASYVDWLTCTGSGGMVFWNAGVPTCLSAGLSGQVLHISGSLPAWTNMLSLGTLALTGGTASTNQYTGDLTVTGGIGVLGDINAHSLSTYGANNAVAIFDRTSDVTNSWTLYSASSSFRLYNNNDAADWLTIQKSTGILSVAGPSQFLNQVTIGLGGTGNTTTPFVINGGSGASGGAYAAWAKNGTGTWYIGNSSVLTGDSLDDLLIENYNSYAATIRIASATNNVTFLGQVNAGGFLTSSNTGIGYSTGAGGTVTQATNKSTGVTLNKISGAITMNGAALGAGTIVAFVLTDSAIAAGDVMVMNHISGGTVGSYTFNAQCTAGSATIAVRNATAGSLSEAVVIQFVVIKGSSS